MRLKMVTDKIKEREKINRAKKILIREWRWDMTKQVKTVIRGTTQKSVEWCIHRVVLESFCYIGKCYCFQPSTISDRCFHYFRSDCYLFLSMRVRVLDGINSTNLEGLVSNEHSYEDEGCFEGNSSFIFNY